MPHSDIQETSNLTGCSLSQILSLHCFLQTEIRKYWPRFCPSLIPVTSVGVFPACGRIEFGPKTLEANKNNNHCRSTLLSKTERKFSKLLQSAAKRILGKRNMIAMRQQTQSLKNKLLLLLLSIYIYLFTYLQCCQCIRRLMVRRRVGHCPRDCAV